jgi:hypothetical protein
MAANTSARNDAAFINARNALAQKWMMKGEDRDSVSDGFAQAVANRLARAGNGIGVVAGAVPAMKANFAVSYQAQKEIQAAKVAAYAIEQAEKVLRA